MIRILREYRVISAVLVALATQAGLASADNSIRVLAVSTEGPIRAFAVEDRVFELSDNGRNCTVSTDEGDLVDLDLSPPCRIVLWQSDPPRRAGDPSEGLSVGGKGDVMAWRYPRAAGGGAVIAVLGDQVVQHIRATEEYSSRLAQGWRCNGSLQAFLIGEDWVAKGGKRGGIGMVCVEQSLDEKDYWMLAHP